MRKISLIFTLMILLASNLFIFNTIVTAKEVEYPDLVTEKKCNVGVGLETDPTNIYKELSMEEKMRLLTEAAVMNEIPPEILKAIATIESNITQFQNGQPLISCDKGIGIMQITNPGFEVDVERLKYDTTYNIEIGAKVLKDKWDLQQRGRIPKINDGNPRILEHWYFALMAYNGLSSVNDPNNNGLPYQMKVYNAIEASNLIKVADFPSLNIEYYDNGTLHFPDKQLDWSIATTESSQMFKQGDAVYVMNSDDPNEYSFANFRNEIDINKPVIDTLPYYTELEIISGPYIGSSRMANQFVIYEVKGSNFQGYIASSNIRKQDYNTVYKQWENKTTSNPKKSWTIKLNQPLNPETIHSKNIYVIDEYGKGIFTKISYDEKTNSIIVAPETAFVAGQNYALRIKDLQNSNGKSLKENIEMLFTISK